MKFKKWMTNYQHNLMDLSSVVIILRDVNNNTTQTI